MVQAPKGRKMLSIRSGPHGPNRKGIKVLSIRSEQPQLNRKGITIQTSGLLDCID